jgi:multiple sugar transport system substrate-binding protein
MPPFAIAQTDSVCIPVGARHPDEAFEFIAFLCSQESLEQLNTNMHKFSPLKTVSREFIENHPNPHVQVFMDLARSPNVFHAPQMSIWYQYRDEVSAGFDRVRLGLATPEEVLPQVQEAVQREWDKEHFRISVREAAERKRRS